MKRREKEEEKEEEEECKKVVIESGYRKWVNVMGFMQWLQYAMLTQLQPK